MQRKQTIRFKDRLMNIDQVRIMGILNITDDSFYSGSRLLGKGKELLRRTGQMLNDGAAIIDVGAMSTRPGAGEIPEQVEIDRIKYACDLILNAYPDVILSIDTYRAEVARIGLEMGASMINDISGFSFDPDMKGVLSTFKPVYVLMHNRAKPHEMREYTDYDSILKEMMQYFQGKMQELSTLGVHDIIIDPGIGFSKTIYQNYFVIRNLNVFQQLKQPVLVGLSRKSFIYRTLGVKVSEALNGSTAMHMYALEKGISMIRTHDVKEAFEVVTLHESLNKR